MRQKQSRNPIFPLQWLRYVVTAIWRAFAFHLLRDSRTLGSRIQGQITAHPYVPRTRSSPFPILVSSVSI
jgi:hypothetical protein